MTQQRIPYIIQLSVSASAYTANPIIDVDYRFAPQQVRTICGSCSGSDTVTILVSPVPSTTASQARPPVITGDLTTSVGAHLSFFVTVSTYSGKWSDIIQGPWARVAVTKTGTSGTATVYLLG